MLERNGLSHGVIRTGDDYYLFGKFLIVQATGLKFRGVNDFYKSECSALDTAMK